MNRIFFLKMVKIKLGLVAQVIEQPVVLHADYSVFCGFKSHQALSLNKFQHSKGTDKSQSIF